MDSRPARLAAAVGPAGKSSGGDQGALLRLLSVAHHEGLDAAPLVENLASECRHRYRRRLTRLSQWIAAGVPLPIALSQTPGVLSDADALLIQCGFETGKADEAFNVLLQQDRTTDSDSAKDHVNATAGYLLMTLLFAAFIVAFLVLFIVPTLKEIYAELEMQLNTPILRLIDFSQTVAAYFPLLFLMLIVAVLLVLSRSLRNRVWGMFLSKWIPTGSRIQKAELLRVLSLATDEDDRMAPLVTAAAQFHREPNLRKRLIAARSSGTTDQELWSQLASYGVLNRRESEQLLQIHSPQIRSWAIQSLASKIRNDFHQQLQWWCYCIQFAFLLALGFFVAWIMLAILRTITDLVTLA